MAAAAVVAGSIAAAAVVHGSMADNWLSPHSFVPEESIAILRSAQAQDYGGGAFMVIVESIGEFSRWLDDSTPGLQGLQVENLIGNPEVWALAAQGSRQLPLDVVLSDPASEFSALYRLVDVHIVRPVRVTIPAKPGFLKALRLAASLQLPVRLVPGQPSPEVLTELTEAAQFYIHDPMVEAPVEFFHSVLATFRGLLDYGTLWTFLEQDPVFVSHRDADAKASLPEDFVESLLARLIHEGAECAMCRWRPVCAGYFKWPNPAYDCAGVKQLFALLESTADEITHDLTSQETTSPP